MLFILFFLSQGCLVVLKTGLLPHHEQQCPFRPFSCLFEKCSWSGTTETFVEHLQTHGTCKVISEANYTGSLNEEDVMPICLRVRV